MELNSTVVTTPPRHAATIMLLRDGHAGLEVFLIKRHGLSDVLGGAYVFPGGKLDPEDGTLDPERHLNLPPAVLHQRLNEAELSAAEAAAFHVAAVREVFEESGVLLALDRTGAVASAEAASARVRAGEHFNDMLQQLDLCLDVASMLPWTRWITPLVPSVQTKRFDTRFFVTTVPAGQQASHDMVEATASAWLSPRAALDQYWAAEIELAPPQIMSLAHLSRHASVASALAEAASRPPPLIQPHPFEHDGTRHLCYPGDPNHALPVRAMPGPLRLRWRNKRFEPVDGFDALFR